MKSLSTYILLIINFLFINGYGQDVAETYKLATHLYELKQYREASQLSHRVIYFADDSMLGYAYALKAECSFFLGDYENAANEFHTAAQICSEPSKNISFQFSECISLLKIKRFLSGQELLLQLDTFTLSAEQKGQWYILMGTTFWLNGMEDSSFYYFNSSLHTDSQKVDLANIRIQAKKKLKLNPKRAEILAALFPGLGHFYAGDVKGGLNSFILTIGLASLAAKVAFTVGPLNAVMAVAPWYYRYYIGGTKNAAHVASQKREARKELLYDQIISLTFDKTQ